MSALSLNAMGSKPMDIEEVETAAAASSTKRGKEGGPWNVLEMGKNHHKLTKRSSCSLRQRLNSLIAIVIVITVIIFTSVTTMGRDDGSVIWGEAAVETCNLFEGRWVFDNLSYPLYSEGMCRFMSDQSACQKFGRENLKYQNWRWKPHGCDLPSFNSTKLLERLRGKRLAFVGDSLNRNQWISMVCLLDSAIPDHMKSMESNGSLTSFKVKGYDASIEFYWAPLLVESNSDDPVYHRIPDRIIRTQSIERHAKHWTGVDALVFNSYLWWRRDKMKVLRGSFDDKDGIYKDIETLRSYEMALKTWAEWLEFHVDHLKTKLFFMSISPTHFRSDEWGIDSSQNCYNETEPISKEGYWGRGSDQKMMHVVESAVGDLRERGVNVQILNITQLSEYRKDGHPSTNRKQWDPLTTQQLADPSSYADCIHWCLPGVPDVWNEILYTYILFK